MSIQKTPLSRTMPLFVEKLVRQAIDKLGKALPAVVQSVSGSIVTVNFQVTGVTLPTVKMPMAGPEYIRYPIQVGCKGVCFPADVYIGGMSGLGTGVAGTTQRGNLSTLVFFPIGNQNWTPSPAPNKVVIYGPSGVQLQDTNAASTLKVTPTDINLDSGGTAEVTAQTSITLSAGGHTLVIDSSGISLDGLLFLIHTHSGVTTGSGVSGPVVP